jgi:putative transposase
MCKLSSLCRVVTRQGQKLLAIHAMPDHVHLLIGLKPSMAISDLVREFKTGSTNHINESKWMAGRFAWQEGFGAFSYAHSQLTDVIKYIQDQEKHHARRGFQEEYREFLERFNVIYDERFLFKSVE